MRDLWQAEQGYCKILFGVRNSIGNFCLIIWRALTSPAIFLYNVNVKSMKYFSIPFALIVLSGCAVNSNDYAIYAETVKSMNRDITMSEIACWQQQDEKSKMMCRKEHIKLEPPRTILDLSK